MTLPRFLCLVTCLLTTSCANIAKIDTANVQKYPFPGQFKGSAAQGMAVSGDTLFLLNNGGLCRVYDLKSNELISNFALGSANKENHANSGSFGAEFPDGNQEFPAFYVSECYGKNRCFVESITRTGSKLIQTIKIDTDGKENKSLDFVVDQKNKILYAIAISASEIDDAGTKKYLITKFLLPPLGKESVSLQKEDILEQFEIQFANLLQGAAIQGNYLYMPVGLDDFVGSEKRKDSHRAIIVVNLKTGKIDETIDIHDIIAGEPEDMDFYKGKILLYCGQKDGGVYQL